METGAIERMRSFNRTVTQRLGAPDDEHLARGVASSPRVLWELGEDGR